MSRLRRFVVIVVMLLMVGCAYSRRMKAGDAAYFSGDYEAALAQYEAALAVDPNSAEAAEKARLSREAIVAEHIDAARAALDGGDILGAIYAAGLAWERLPELDATRQIILTVSNATFEKAQILALKKDYANALDLLETLQTALPTEAEKSQPRVDEVRDTWVSALKSGAEAAEAAGRLGDATLQYAKLSQLTSDPTYGGKRDELRNKVLEQHAYVVTVGGRGKEGLTSVLAAVEALGEGTALRVLSRAPRGSDVAARATFRVDRPRFRTDKTTRVEKTQYASGTKQVENPFYRSRQDDLLREEQRLLKLENDVTSLESDVDRYRAAVAKEGDTPNVSTGAEQNLYNAENRLESARRSVEDQRRTVIRRKEELSREPQFKEEPVYSDLEYTVTTHTVIAELTFKGSVKHSDKRSKLDVSAPLATQASDDAHSAYPVANISEDPLQLPDRDTLAAELYARAQEAAVRLIEESFDQWRAALAQKAVNAGSDDERVDLLATYIITAPARVVPSVPTDIAALRGIPDAVRVLTPGTDEGP